MLLEAESPVELQLLSMLIGGEKSVAENETTRRHLKINAQFFSEKKKKEKELKEGICRCLFGISLFS